MKDRFMITKRKFLTATAALAITTMAGLSPALAIGGNDPIGGIDIIVKKDPGSRPIKPFSLGKGALKTLNSLKGTDRPTFVLKTIAKRIDVGEGFVGAGMKALGDIWCGPCKMANQIEVKFTDGDITYSLHLTFMEK